MVHSLCIALYRAVLVFFNIPEEIAFAGPNAFSPYISSTSDMQCNCMMGVFPEISRAWLTIDSDIFMWNYEDGYVENTFLIIYC